MLLAPESLFSAEVVAPVLVFAALALLAALLFRRERRLIAGLVLLFGLSLVLRAAGAGLDELGLRSAARTTTFLALLLQGIGFVNLGAIVLFDVVVPAVHLAPPRLLRDLLTGFAYVVLVLGLFARERVDVSGIVATSAVITAVIGFSLQDTLANVLGGVALQLDGAIRPGDWVRVGEHAGRVTEVGWRRTTLETRNGDGVIVPNSAMVRSTVVVEGRPGACAPLERRTVLVGLPYAARLEEVIDVLVTAMGESPPEGVSPLPAPEAIVTGLRDWQVEYAVRFFTPELSRPESVDSAVRIRILHALRRSGFEPALPLQTHVVEMADEGREGREGERLAAERLAALSAAAVFRVLTADERRALAAQLKPLPFAPGELVVRQGEEGRDLFVLARGEVEVQVAVSGAAPVVVATLSAPEVFGEMGPLTGEPRRATVVAGRRGALCFSLGKEPLQQLLASRPELADDVSQVLAQREVALTAVQEGLSDEAARSRLALEHSGLSHRIRSFFGMV